MIPARRAFVLFALASFVLAGSVVSPGARTLALLADGLLLLLVWIDWRRAAATALTAERGWPEVIMQRHRDAEGPSRQHLILTLCSPKGSASGSRHRSQSIQVRLREILHPAIALQPFAARLTVAPGLEYRLDVKLDPEERGEHLAGPLMVRVLGPLGLCWSQRQLLPPEPVCVYPRVRWGGRVGQLLALAQRNQLGSVALDQRGVGGELYSLRRYRSGDTRSRIHWKATARRGYLVTREDAWERGTPVVVLLDCGRSMSARADSLAKLDHSLAASLALTRLVASRGEKVTLIAFSDSIHRTVRVHPGKSGVAAAYRQLFDLAPRSAESLYDLAAETVLQMSLPRSTVLLMTSVVDLAIAELLLLSLRRLARRHRPLLINLEDPSIRQMAEEPPRTPPEAYAKISSLEILLGNRRLTQQLRLQGMPAVTAPADRLAIETLEMYLETLDLGTKGRSRHLARARRVAAL